LASLQRQGQAADRLPCRCPCPPDAGHRQGRGTADPDLPDRRIAQHPEGLTIWLALWGEIAVNPTLSAEHLRHDRTHHAPIAQAAARPVGRDLPEAEDKTLATARIALLDGIWLEFLIAPEKMSRARARAAVEALVQGAGRRAGTGMIVLKSPAAAELVIDLRTSS
jgi:hypothetical protein